MVKWLRGIGLPPVLVGGLRGLAEAVCIGAIEAGLIELTALDFGQWAFALPPALYGMRQAEALADHIDPEKRRGPEG